MTRQVAAMVLEAPRRLVPRNLEAPQVGEDDALLRVEACGLCGTDHEQFSGDLFGGFPFVPGHESVGVLEEVGPAAQRRWGVRAGQRVAVEVFQSCGACSPCREGSYRRCEAHGLADMYGFIPLERAPGLWGGYAEVQYLAPDSLVLPVPDGLDPVVATLFNPVGAGIRWAATLPETRPGDVVAVLGPGIRGLASAAAAKDAGAEVVLVTGRGHSDVPRLAAARDFGADLVVDVAEEDPVRRLHEVTGRGADVVVDVTARAPEAFTQALELAAPGATVVVAGTRGAEALPSFSPDLLVYKELRVLGALGVDVEAYRAALGLLASRRWPFEEVSRRVVSFGDLEDLLAAMASGADAPVHGVVVPGGNDG